MRKIHRSPVNSPHIGQWRGALTFSLVCDWINGWVNTREAGYLTRHRTHYDVIVMQNNGLQGFMVEEVATTKKRKIMVMTKRWFKTHHVDDLIGSSVSQGYCWIDRNKRHLPRIMTALVKKYNFVFEWSSPVRYVKSCSLLPAFLKVLFFQPKRLRRVGGSCNCLIVCLHDEITRRWLLLCAALAMKIFYRSLCSRNVW